jgi:hypothetical protein
LDGSDGSNGESKGNADSFGTNRNLLGGSRWAAISFDIIIYLTG